MASDPAIRERATIVRAARIAHAQQAATDAAAFIAFARAVMERETSNHEIELINDSKAGDRPQSEENAHQSYITDVSLTAPPATMISVDDGYDHSSERVAIPIQTASTAVVEEGLEERANDRPHSVADSSGTAGSADTV